MTIIPRMHLAELDDQDWFPGLIRDLTTDYLRFLEEVFGVHKHAFPVLQDALARTGSEHVLDLCSGGGGPCVALQRELATAGKPVRFTLTDIYPNFAAFEEIRRQSGGAIDFVSEPVDATNVPVELTGFRTFFNSFHHFDPADAEGILADAVANNRAIAVFEIPRRALANLLGFLMTPLAVWLATPFIRPFKWSRFFWTYLIPAVPFACFWDGIVSHFRAYTARELLELAHPTEATHYEWHSGESRVPPAPLKVTYLVGYPLAPVVAAEAGAVGS